MNDQLPGPILASVSYFQRWRNLGFPARLYLIHIALLTTSLAIVGLLFNLAVLEEDLGRAAEAADHYRAALDAAPDFADAHFNLARLCEAQGRRQEAVRHLSAFRRLSAGHDQ